MHLNYQRKTLTALLAASVSLLQPFLSAGAENSLLLAAADDPPMGDSVLYRQRWSTPGTGHIGKLQLAPIVAPQPAVDANAAAVNDQNPALPASTTSATIQPIIQAAPARPKPKGGAPFEWPHADGSDAQPVHRNAQPVAQHTAQPVTQKITAPIAQQTSQAAAPRLVHSVGRYAAAAQPVGPGEAESTVTDQAAPAQPPAQAPLKIQRLTLSPSPGMDTDTPVLPKPAQPRPSLPPSVSTATLPKPALSKPLLLKPILPEQSSPGPASSDPSAIIPSLSTGNLGETEQNSKPTEAPTPGKHTKSAEKLGSPAAFVQPSAGALGSLQNSYAETPKTIIAYDTTSPTAIIETLPSLALPAVQKRASTQPLVIESGISIWDTANIDKILETLVDSHFSNSKEAQALDKKIEHFNKAPAKAVAIVKDSLNTSMRIGGTDPSARGGRIVLDENLKITDKATAEYERQRYVDKIHSHIVSALAEIAMGLGTVDADRRAQIIDAGTKSLSSLVGDDKAKNTVQGLTTWLSRNPVSDETFKKPVWDTMERETKLETVLKAALAKDPVVAEVRKRVYRYAHPGKLKSGTSKVVEGTLATVSWLSPGFAIPIGAEVALDAYIAATGGSEESKLEKELIYDKRIQSRLKVLDQEATLALDNYRFAVVTKNPSLLAFSEALIADMANEHVAEEVLVGQVIGGDVKKQAEQVIPGIKESKTAEQGILKALTKEVTRL